MSNNIRPNWLETYINSVGSDSIPSNSNTGEEEYKQASSNNSTEVPAWYVTFTNRTL
jgi:hypothetical protein